MTLEGCLRRTTLTTVWRESCSKSLVSCVSPEQEYCYKFCGNTSESFGKVKASVSRLHTSLLGQEFVSCLMQESAKPSAPYTIIQCHVEPSPDDIAILGSNHT